MREREKARGRETERDRERQRERERERETPQQQIFFSTFKVSFFPPVSCGGCLCCVLG